MTEIEQLLAAYGYEEIESKNGYMRSYSDGESRANYYYTSGTITFQRFDRKGGVVSIRSATPEGVEDHLIKQQ